MKPVGRGVYKDSKAKHEIKHFGKHVDGWWVDIVEPKKSKFKRESFKLLEEVVLEYKENKS